MGDPEVPMLPILPETFSETVGSVIRVRWTACWQAEADHAVFWDKRFTWMKVRGWKKYPMQMKLNKQHLYLTKYTS